MNLDSFYAKYPSGSRVDTDGVPKSQPYQCVDLTKIYLNLVFGMPVQAYGDARQYWDNPKILAKFDRITDGSKQDGDILVWGDDKGNWTGVAGHIAIWYKGKIYNQNYNGSGRISLNNFFPNGYIGALRIKGGKMSNFTKEQEQTAAIMATGYIPGKDYNYPFTVKEINSGNLDAFLQTWQSRMSNITAEMEQTVAKIATGSPYGKDYNSQFQGKPVLSNLQPMLNFWLTQRQVPSANFKPYDGKQLFTQG